MAASKWENDDEIHYPLDLNQQCRRISHISISSRLRSFQFRFLHRAIVLNIHLFHWGITDSKRCSMCSKEDETLKDLFFKCDIVSEIWQQTECFIHNTTGQEVFFTWENVVLCKEGQNVYSIVDCIILIV